MRGRPCEVSGEADDRRWARRRPHACEVRGGSAARPGGQRCPAHPISSTSSRSMWTPSTTSSIVGWAIVRTRRISRLRSSSRPRGNSIHSVPSRVSGAGCSPWRARPWPIIGDGTTALEPRSRSTRCRRQRRSGRTATTLRLRRSDWWQMSWPHCPSDSVRCWNRASCMGTLFGRRPTHGLSAALLRR